MIVHRFDIVPIRIQNEASVVIFSVLRARSRSAVIYSSGEKGGLIELINLFFIWCTEGNMHTGDFPDVLVLHNFKETSTADIKRIKYTFLAKRQLVAQRLEDFFIESQTSFKIANFDGYVINHSTSLNQIGMNVIKNHLIICSITPRQRKAMIGLMSNPPIGGINCRKKLR